MFRVETLGLTYCDSCSTFLNNTLDIFVFCNIQANFTVGFDGSVINLNIMSKIMLKYKPNGRRRLGRPLCGLLDEAETGVTHET
jgi:hypothetical protein